MESELLERIVKVETKLDMFLDGNKELKTLIEKLNKEVSELKKVYENIDIDNIEGFPVKLDKVSQLLDNLLIYMEENGDLPDSIRKIKPKE